MIMGPHIRLSNSRYALPVLGYWKVYLGKQETPLVVVASGLVLGEGVVSILSLVMASMNVPHF